MADSESPVIKLFERVRALNADSAIDDRLACGLQGWKFFVESLEQRAAGEDHLVLEPLEILAPVTVVQEHLAAASELCRNSGVHAALSELVRIFEDIAEEAERGRVSAVPKPHRLRMELALPVFERQLAQARAQDNREDQAAILQEMGWLYDELRRNAKALACHREALRICNELGDRRGCARNLHMMGVAYRHLGRYEDALAGLADSMRLSQSLGDRQQEALSQAESGLIHEARGDLEEAERCLTVALATLAHGGEPENIAHCQATLERLRQRRATEPTLGGTLGRADARPALREENREVAVAASSRALNQHEILVQGLELSRQGHGEEAFVLFLEAAAAFRTAGDLHGALTCESQAGQALNLLGRSAEAQNLLERAAHEAAANGDPALNSEILSALGEVLLVQGQYELALPILNEAKEAARAEGAPLLNCMAGVRLGTTLKLLGRLSEALVVLNEAARDALAIEPNPLTLQTRCDAFIDLGSLLRLLGRHRESLKWLKQACEEALQLSDPLTSMNALRELGACLSDTGQWMAALEALLEATQKAEATQAPLSRCQTFRLLATVQRHLGAPDLALAALDQAAHQAQLTGDPLSVSTIASERALVLLSLGRGEEAREAIDRGLMAPPSEPNTLCHLFMLKGHIAAQRNEWEACRGSLQQAQMHLSEALSHNRWPRAMAELLSHAMYLFSLGFEACERIWSSQHEEAALWDGLGFAEAAKCVAIREGLRRHSRRGPVDPQPAPWRASPVDWRQAFSSATGGWGGEPPRSTTRGVRTQLPAADLLDWELELPDEGDAAKDALCAPWTPAALAAVASEEGSVFLSCFFHDDDLSVIPLRAHPLGLPELQHVQSGYFRVRGARPVVESLRLELDRALEQEMKCGERGVVRRVCVKLFESLRLGELLSLIEPSAERRLKLHLIWMPDGPLARLPLHAALDPATGTYLYEAVASVRYSLSLRTLELQQAIEQSRAAGERQDRTLRGVAFAWPDRTGCFLPAIREEVRALVEETSGGNWWIHGELGPPEQRAHRAALRRAHRTGNLGWVMTHGTPAAVDEITLEDGREVRVCEPGLLLADGFVSMSRMMAEGYDFSAWRLFHLSACLLGQLEPLGGSKELLGYVATLTCLGCRRIVSALWELNDEAATEFSRHWIRALARYAYGESEPGPHAFSLALQEALNAFRRVQQGRFDDECYWAPYLLYGLG